MAEWERGHWGLNLGQQGTGLQAQEAERPPTGTSLRAASEVDEMWRGWYTVAEGCPKSKAKAIVQCGLICYTFFVAI